MKNKRKPLSMLRLNQLATNYLIDKGYEGKDGDKKFSAQEAEYVQAVLQPTVLEFLSYVWEHKDDEDIFDFPFKYFKRDFVKDLD